MRERAGRKPVYVPICFPLAWTRVQR